jgi:hypothetical protein
MITNEQIIELAKTCGFEEFIGERDDETDGVYYQFWEDQLVKFYRKAYSQGWRKGDEEGYDQGCYEATGGN